MAACMWKWVSCTTPGCCIPQCTPVPPKARGVDNAPAAGGALRTGLCTQAREYPIPLFLVLPCVPGCDAITPVMHQNRGELPSAPSSTPYPKTPRAGGSSGSCHPRQLPGNLRGCAHPASRGPSTALARVGGNTGSWKRRGGKIRKYRKKEKERHAKRKRKAKRKKLKTVQNTKGRGKEGKDRMKERDKG